VSQRPHEADLAQHRNICDGVCDSCDLYGVEHCEFYDISPAATCRFLKALYHEQTAEFQFAKAN
jgi:hypothetical protein